MNCHRRSTVAPSPFARKPLAIFTALVSLGLPLTAVCADEEEQPSGATANAAPLEVGSTVVTASGFSQDVRDAPASISVITREELKRTWNPSWRGSMIGFFIGILPGAGATLAQPA